MTQTRRTTSRTTSRTQWLLPLLFFCWLALTRSSEDEAHKQSLFQQLIHHGNGLRARHATTPTLAPTLAPTLPADASFKHQRRLRKRKHKLHRPRHKPGRHVCTHEETVTRPIKVVESYCKPVYKSFTQRCANGTNACTAFRVQYETFYRTVVKYHTTKEQKHQCCPGWTHPSKIVIRAPKPSAAKNVRTVPASNLTCANATEDIRDPSVR